MIAVSKRCTKCQLEKPRDQFAKHRQRRDGLQPYCRACNTAIQRERLGFKPRDANRYADGLRRCYACHQRKPVAAFSPGPKTRGVRSYCRPCDAAKCAQQRFVRALMPDAAFFRRALRTPEPLAGADLERFRRLDRLAESFELRPVHEVIGPGHEEIA